MEATKRVVIRAKYLEVSNNKSITVFTELKKDKIFKYINGGHVTKLLREVAKEINNIKCSKAFSKFTPYSIRVGAYVKFMKRAVTLPSFKHTFVGVHCHSCYIYTIQRK